MYSSSAKERLAQLQQKGSKDTQVGKLAVGLKPTPGKLNGGPGQVKKPEPPKPAVDLKKPVAPQPVKPKEEPKAPVVPEPAKPKEEPKAPVVPQPAKPKEEPKKPAAPEPVKPKEEPKAPVVPQPAKPKEEPKKPAAPEPVKPKEEPKAPAVPQPAVPQPAKPAVPEPAKPKEEPKAPAVPQPAVPQPAKPAVPEPAKPKEEPKQPAAPEPAKPKEEPKKPAAPEPAKPKEEPKKPAAPEPAKPKEEPKAPAVPQPAKPKEEPKKPAAPEPAKPKEEPKKPTAPEPAKPKEEPKKPAAPEPAKPAQLPSDATVKLAGEPAAAKPVEEPKKPSDDFFRGIFYFSGMGTLVGSALAEGVYVPEKTQRNALDSDEIESARERQKLRRGEEIIVTARNQAQGLSTDFRHLQALLESLPTFTEALEPQPLDRRAVDQVIHGHVYFQQEQHPAPTHSRPVHHHLTSAEAEIVSHVPQQQQHQPMHVVAEAKRVPVGGVPVMPDLTDHRHHRPAADQHHRPAADQHKETASFAAAIDEFDRAFTASHQQPVLATPPPHRPPSEPSRPHPRERPTAAEEHGEVGGAATRPFGVHTGHAVPPTAASTQPWQERYGQTEVTKFAAPRPFSATGGEIDSKGIKSWQMSHLRTLEAKGYHIVSDSEQDAVKSYAPYLVSDRSQGADRQFSFHHQHPQHQHPEHQHPQHQHLQHQHPQHQHPQHQHPEHQHPQHQHQHPQHQHPQHQHHVVGPSPHATGGVEPPVSATSYKPPAATNAPFAQSLDASVGYSDL